MKINSTIVFLGDSLTERGNWKELFPEYNILNYGISGNKTYEILNRLNEVIVRQPDKIFLMAGINDLGENRNANEIIADYNSIIENINNESSNTGLFLLSILPVAENRAGLKNEHIKELNYQIENIANNKHIKFINMFNAFVTTSGQINPKYSNDGLHLSKEGYILWKQLIKNFI